MKPYVAMLGARFRMLLQYRAAALAGFGTQLFFGYVIVMGYKALYAATSQPQPMSLQEVISYVWLGQAMLALMPWRSDGDVASMIRSGQVASELLRPVDLYWMWYSRTLAQRIAPTILRALPLFIVAGLFLGLQAPAGWAGFSAWLAATFCALLLAAAVSCLATISMFWTISGGGVNNLLPGVVWFFSGMLVPLPLMPDWLRQILEWLPFRAIVDIPFRLYLGHIPAESVWSMMVIQLTWAATLILIGQAVLQLGVRRVVVQGG
ncbi:MAG: ABC transporter permease [Candidatus Sumerlaeia bacterium]